MSRNRVTVLVAGGAGFVGSHVVLALLDEGYPVVVFDDLSSGLRTNVDPRAVFFAGSLHNPSLIRTIIELHGVAAIIHLAGTSPSPGGSSDPLRHYRSNTSGTAALIDCAVSAGVRHIVYSSTTEGYSPSEMLVAEDHPCWPEGPHAASHFAAELMLAHVAETCAMNFGVLRYGFAVGADRLQRCGHDLASHGGQPNVLRQAVEVVVGMRDQVEIRKSAEGQRDPLSDYVHVSDVARAHALLLAQLIGEPNQSHVYNCGYGRGWSDADVVDAVERMTSTRIATRRMSGAGANQDRICDAGRLQSELGWRPDFADLDTLARDTYYWYLRQPRPTAAPRSPQPRRAAGNEPIMRKVDGTVERHARDGRPLISWGATPAREAMPDTLAPASIDQTTASPAPQSA